MSNTSAREYPALPYPGARPTFSYVLDRDRVYPIVRCSDGPWVFPIDRTSVSRWLVARGVLPIEDRTPLLCYGSNACPGKLLDMRRRFGLPGPVVMTQCTVLGAAAVLCDGTRSDGAVPATLAPFPGSEKHFVWWVAPGQWPSLDACEGRRAGYYDMVDVQVPVLDERDDPIQQVLTFVGARPERRPALDSSAQPVLLTPRPEAA